MYANSPILAFETNADLSTCRHRNMGLVALPEYPCLSADTTQLIYHASVIGQATGKNKGKIARMLAAKSALGLRVDALSTWGISSEDASKEPTEEEKSQLGRDARLNIERRLRALEGKPLKSMKDTANANTTALGQKKWEVKEARKYNPDADGLTGDEPAAKKSKTNGVNGTPKKLVQEVDSDADMPDADAGADASESDDDEEEKAAPKGDSKAAKKAEKEAKKARKAERSAKRAAKEAKKAAKEAKKGDKDSKKRKADDGDDKDSKKKKKKSKD
jgi:nucleolar protein 58